MPRSHMQRFGRIEAARLARGASAIVRRRQRFGTHDFVNNQHSVECLPMRYCRRVKCADGMVDTDASSRTAKSVNVRKGRRGNAERRQHDRMTCS